MAWSDFFRFVEKSIPIGVGLPFAVVGVIVVAKLPDSRDKMAGADPAFLAFTLPPCYSSVGVCHKRFLAISGMVVLALFFVVAVGFGR